MVTVATKWKEIITHHALYSSAHTAARQLPADMLVLAYVTPVGNAVLPLARQSRCEMKAAGLLRIPHVYTCQLWWPSLDNV